MHIVNAYIIVREIRSLKPWLKIKNDFVLILCVLLIYHSLTLFSLSQVDMFSYAMFLYEMISLYFPYEKQNIMASQIEKLTIQGERPPLHSRVSGCVLHNPAASLYVV